MGVKNVYVWSLITKNSVTGFGQIYTVQVRIKKGNPYSKAHCSKVN